MTHTLQEVPQEIRSWLGSDGVTFYLIDLNNRLSLADYGMTLIPNLLYRLVIQDLPAQNFTTTLSEELELMPSSAKEIAKEIEKKVLEPVRRALLEWGVDITLIQIGDVAKEGIAVEEKIIGSAPLPALPLVSERIAPPPPSVPPVPPPVSRVRIIEQAPATPGFTASAPKIIESAPPTLETAPVRLTDEQKKAALAEKLDAIVRPIGISGGEPVVAKAPPKEVPIHPQEIKLAPGLLPTLKEEGNKIRLKEDAPFMLHEEKKLEPTIEAKTFKSNIEFAPPKPAPKPITARVEMGDANENKPRVVHYNEMRTSLPAELRQAGLSPEIAGARVAPQGAAGGGTKPTSPDVAAKEPALWRGAAPVAGLSPAPGSAPTPPPPTGGSAPVNTLAPKQDPQIQGNVVDLR